ncbi:MAG: hypothetical protein IIY06_13980 [Proteobacteria bacterium]|jgi:hypothetical protein|nr:hypothetical protein [Pseudomonadota bacterium]
MKQFIRTMLLTGVFVLFPLIAFAQSHTVAIFAPSLDFADGGARNAFVSKIAKSLSDQTGMTWTASAFARASDFESARSSVDLAILDADYFSGKSGSLKPIAMLSSNGSTSRRLKVIAKRGSSDKLFNYRGKRLTLVSSSSLVKSFFTSNVLGNEISVDKYFGSVDEARDLRSAINALELGKADLTMTFEGYESGFTTVYTSPAVALPVIAMNVSKFSSADAERVKQAVLEIKPSSSIVNGIAAYSATDASAFKRIAGEKKENNLEYQVMDPENISIPVKAIVLKDRTDGMMFNPFLVNYIPTLDEVDLVLDKRL